MSDSRIKGITIEINGDVTGLNKALESTNKKLSSSQRQLKDVERLLKLDPKNTELLAQKQRLLGESISATKEKLEKLKKAEQQAAAKLETGGKDAQEQYEALHREIISTEIDLGKLEKRAADAGKSLNDAAQDAKEKVSGFGTAAKVAGVAAAAAFAAAAAAAVAAAKALVDMTVGGAAYADTVLTESTVTGIATDKLQEYMYAAELVDVSTETLTKSMAKNIKSMKSAADGSAAYAEAYEALGISVTDASGELRDSESVYWEAIDTLGKIENETERDALAMQLFGKSAQELNPLIEAGAKRMQELGEKAHEAGYVISDDMLQSYGALDDQLRYLEGGAAAAKNALGTILLPMLTELATDGVDLLGEFTNGILDADGDIGKMSDVIRQVLPKAIDSIMEFVPELIEVGGELISALGAGIIDNLPQIADAAANVTVMLLQGLVKALPQLISGLKELLKSVLNAVADALPAVIDGIVDAAMAIADALPEVLDAIIDALPQIIDTLIAALPKVIKGIITALPKVLGTVVDAIIKLAPMLLDAGIGLVEALWDGIVGAFDDLKDGFEDLFSNLWDGLTSLFYDGGEDAATAGAKSLENGIKKNTEKPEKAAKKLSEKIIDAVDDAKGAQQAGENISSAVANGISDNSSVAESAAENLAGKVVYVADKVAREIIQTAEEAAGDFRETLGRTAQEIRETASEYDYVEGLADELLSLADANGFVEQANRSRASFILDELSRATGEEWTMIDGTIQKYGDLKSAIFDMIAARRTETMLELYETDYREALAQRKEAYDALIAARDEYLAALESGDESAIAKTAVDYQEAVNNYAGYMSTIAKYENAYEQMLSGTYDEAESILNNTEGLFDESTRLTLKSARNWVSEAARMRDEAKQAYQENPSEVNRLAFEAAQGNYMSAISAYANAYYDAAGIGGDMVDGLISGIESGNEPLAFAVTALIDSALEAGRVAADSHSPSRKTMALGEDMGDGGVIGVINKIPQMRKAGGNLALSMLDGFSDFADTLTSNMAVSPAALIGVPTPATMQHQSSVGATYNSSVSFGGVSVYVNAPNVDNVEGLADLVADRINTSIIEKQAVYTR